MSSGFVYNFCSIFGRLYDKTDSISTLLNAGVDQVKRWKVYESNSNYKLVYIKFSKF